MTLAEVYSTVSNNEGLANAAKFIKLATQINDLANTASQTGSAAINLGSFKIAGGAGAIAGLDLRNTSLASLDEARISQIAGVLGNIPLLGDVLKFVNATEILAGAAGGLGGLGGNQGGFDFPIIKKPLLVLQALLGGKPEGIVFFTFQTPKISLDALLDLQIPIFPPFLTAFLSGGISADMQFGFGFDASDMAKFVDSGEPADIFDGFYISDRKNPDGTGPDIAEVVVSGVIEVGAFAGVRAGPVDISASAQGGIYATIEANLNDPNNSGRVHPSELASVVEQGLECLIDLTGSVKAAASISVTVEGFGITVFDDSYEFASATLLEGTQTIWTVEPKTITLTAVLDTTMSVAAAAMTSFGAEPTTTSFEVTWVSINCLVIQGWIIFLATLCTVAAASTCFIWIRALPIP